MRHDSVDVSAPANEEADMTSASDGSGSPAQEGDATREAGPTQDVKDKFREALERKRQSATAHAENGAERTGKVHSAHGAESHRKEFRRKSGG
jgi:hypothetical protein